VKTISLKKVSAVAVASLGFGLLSVVPAQASVATVAALTTVDGDATNSIVYTTVGTEVLTDVFALTTTDTTEADTLTITPTITSQPAGDTLSVGTAGSGKVGMKTSGTLGANVATTATADKHTLAVSAGVATLTWSSGTIPAFAENAEQVVGQLSVTPTTAGRYVIAITPSGATTTNTAVNLVIYASGASGTVGTAGVGTAALTAQQGGQAAMTYTFPNGASVGTIYRFQSAGVGSIIGATGKQTDNSTAMNPVPYNGTAGDFSAGASWTTASVTTSGTATLTLNSSTAGTQTVSVTRIDATTGSPVAVASLTVTWTAATSLNLTTLQVSTLPGNANGNCTVANKANADHNSVTRVPASEVTNSTAAHADICVIAMNGNGTAMTLSSLTVGTAGPGLVALTAVGGSAATTYGLGSVSADLDGEATFNTAGSLLSGATTYLVSAKALNTDGVTSTTLTGSVTVNFVDSKVATATLTQLKYALDDGAASTAVANFVLADKAKLSMAGGATSNLLVDSDIASTLVVDAAGETDASAAVTVSTATSVAADGTVTKGVISVDCTATAYEKLTIWMHFESNTVPSNKITVYCTNDTVGTLVIGASNTTAGASQKVTATATAGITSKPSYPTADSATATFSVLLGTLSSTSAVNFENGVAEVNYGAPAASGKATIKVVPSDVATVPAFALGVTKDIVIAASSDLSSLTTQIDALNAKIVALNALIAKIMKKLGVK
jgi:hypothetical protein